MCCNSVANPLNPKENLMNLAEKLDLARSSVEAIVDRLGLVLGAIADLEAEASGLKAIIKSQVPVGSAVEGRLYRAAVASTNRLMLDKARVIQYLDEQFGVQLDDAEFNLQLCKPVESVSVRVGARKA
jgi:hypothetical protein